MLNDEGKKTNYESRKTGNQIQVLTFSWVPAFLILFLWLSQ